MKQEKEIKVVALMIRRYCKGIHKTKRGEVCADCAELLEYVKLRRSRCPYGDDKSFCANCKTHCYKPVMRQKIREVMWYSGPRIMFRHPILSLQHLLESKRQKKINKRQEINDK